MRTEAYSAIAAVCMLLVCACTHESEMRQLYGEVRPKLGLSAIELVGVERATELNPGILSAAFARVTTKEDPKRLVTSGDPRLLSDLKDDLVQRAQLVAIADGRVLSDTASSEVLRAESVSASPSTLGIPKGDLAAALRALAVNTKVVKPLCPDGQLKSRADGTPVCVPGDPYSPALFATVVPVFVNGKLGCTGTLIDKQTLLTAAHCLIDFETAKLLDVQSLAVMLPGAQRASAVTEPRVPAAMLRPCKPPDYVCPDFGLDIGLLSYESMSTISTFPSLEKLDSAGSVDITMAGYGATTMVPDPSSGGLYVGRQNVELSSPSAALGWIYNFTNDNTSSTCLGDSGGPIFLGSPRKNGDPLRIVAVISRIERVLSGQGSSDRATGPCVNADVRAVNLATKEVAEAVCSLGGQRPAFCNQ